MIKCNTHSQFLKVSEKQESIYFLKLIRTFSKQTKAKNIKTKHPTYITNSTFNVKYWCFLPKIRKQARMSTLTALNVGLEVLFSKVRPEKEMTAIFIEREEINCYCLWMSCVYVEYSKNSTKNTPPRTKNKTK